MMSSDVMLPNHGSRPREMPVTTGGRTPSRSVKATRKAAPGATFTPPSVAVIGRSTVAEGVLESAEAEAPTVLQSATVLVAPPEKLTLVA